MFQVKVAGWVLISCSLIAQNTAATKMMESYQSDLLRIKITQANGKLHQRQQNGQNFPCGLQHYITTVIRIAFSDPA